jgi:hypothetical protein
MPTNGAGALTTKRFVVADYASQQAFAILVPDTRKPGDAAALVSRMAAYFHEERAAIDKLPPGSERARRGRLWSLSCPNRTRTMLIEEALG